MNLIGELGALGDVGEVGFEDRVLALHALEVRIDSVAVGVGTVAAPVEAERSARSANPCVVRRVEHTHAIPVSNRRDDHESERRSLAARCPWDRRVGCKHARHQLHVHHFGCRRGREEEMSTV